MKGRCAAFFVLTTLAVLGSGPAGATVSFDPTYAGGGWATMQFHGSEYAANVGVDANDRIILSGASNGNFKVAQYNADGTPDASYSSYFMDYFSSFEIAAGAAVQNGLTVIAGTSASEYGAGYDFAVARVLADGKQDDTFGSSGWALTYLGGTQDRAHAMAVQSDGKIVVAGQTGDSLNLNIVLLRYNADGSTDTTFGSNGVVITDLSSYDVAYSVRIDASDRIVVGGTTLTANGLDFVLLRYNAAGMLDFTFGTNGHVTTDFAGGDDIASSIRILSSGEIVAAGSAFNGTDFDFALAKYGSNGVLVILFGSFGRVMHDFGGTLNSGTALRVQPDGKLVLAGSSGTGTSMDFAVARYNTDGTIDTAFGSSGVVTTDFSGGPDSLMSVAFQSDGKIVVSGQAYNDVTGYDFAMARYTTSGVLDPTFNGSGKTTTDFLQPSDVTSAAIQNDGKTILAGVVGHGNYMLALARLNRDGTVDSTFGVNGVVQTSLTTGWQVYNDVALQADGKIVAVGAAIFDGDYDLIAVRYNSDGSLDSSFGQPLGYARINIQAADLSYSVAIQPDGKILIGGLDDYFGDSDGVIARLNPDGTTDTSFGGGSGYFTLNVSSEYDAFLKIMVQPDGRIVAAGNSFSTADSVYKMLVARLNPDGTLDAAFGGGSGYRIVVLPAALETHSYSAALQPDGKILVSGFAYFAGPSGNADFALARLNGNGSMDSTFGTNGWVTTDFNGFDDIALAVQVRRDGKILVVGTMEPLLDTPYTQIAIARYTSSGAPDTNFAPGGSVHIADPNRVDLGWKIFSLPGGRILLAGTSGVQVEGRPGKFYDYNSMLAARLIGCLFCDDFEDGVLAPDWDYGSAGWTETGGALVATATTKKAQATASPAFGGCNNCTFEASLQFTGGGSSQVWMLPWYLDKNNTVEVLLKEESGKWILRQKLGGTKVKTKAIDTIMPNHTYRIRVTFDGANITLFVDDVMKAVLPALAAPSGTIGFKAKNTTLAVDSVDVN